MSYYQQFSKLEKITGISYHFGEDKMRFYCPKFYPKFKTSNNDLEEVLLFSALDSGNRGALVSLKLSYESDEAGYSFSEIVAHKSLRSFYQNGITPMAWLPKGNDDYDLVCACWSDSIAGSRYTIWPGILNLSNPNEMQKIVLEGLPMLQHDIVSISEIKAEGDLLRCWFALSKKGEHFVNKRNKSVSEYHYCHGFLKKNETGWQIEDISICEFERIQNDPVVGVGRSELVFIEEEKRYVGLFSIRKSSGYLKPEFFSSIDGINWRYIGQSFNSAIRETLLIFGNTIVDGNRKLVCGNKSINGDYNLQIYIQENKER